MAVDWSEYDEWNLALDARLFTRDHDGLPAYVDGDPELLDLCAKDLSLDGDGLKKLVAAVQPTLGLDGGPALAEHDARFRRWRRSLSRAVPTARREAVGELPPPPVLALLTVLVAAAGRMGADSTMSASAYYPRLFDLLGISPSQGQRLKSRFPVTELYWRGLNDYLARFEGAFGLPTAYALGHRYVGIPQSQALIRATDRNKLPGFFRTFGLTPGSELAPTDVERLLDAWITAHPSPVSNNLARLWGSGKARERVAGVVAVELAAWDGRYRDSSEIANARGDLAITALVRQQFGRKSIELSFAATFPKNSESPVLNIESAEGNPAIGVVPGAGGRRRPVPGTRLDHGSLVGALLELRDPETGQVVSRRPRRVVPLRRDELLGVMTEVDRVQLADDAVLLVRDDESLVTKVVSLLEQYGHFGEIFAAEPGEGRTALTGLPADWLLIDDVQLYAVPQEIKHLDLQALVPITTAQLTLSGGLKMPGRMRKWSSLHPPEIRAAVDGAEDIAITLLDLDEDRSQLERWAVDASALAIPLDGLDLDDGDYEVELSVSGETVSITTLRLRSGAAPDAVSWEQAARLNYDLFENPLAVVSATESDGDSPRLVDGPNSTGTGDERETTISVVENITWSQTSSSSKEQNPTIVLGLPDPGSCMFTGKHRIELPTFHGGRSRGVIEGVCGTCGIRKVYPARPKWKLSASSPRTVHSIVPDMPAHSNAAVTWDACLDALVHVGGGSVGALERVATQREGSSLFVDSFLRTLEGLGHIDVARDESLQPSGWEANPAYLAETCGRGFALLGVWSNSTRKRLERELERIGASLEREGDPDTVSAWFVRGATAGALSDLIDDTGMDAYVVPNAVSRMLDVLPSLGSLEAALPAVDLPAYNKAAIFDVPSAAWRTTPGVGAPGAYRLEQSFRTRTLWVDSTRLMSRQGRVGSVQLVKHLAARASGRALVGWLPRSQMLVVPLGADLPGLYGRVAMLCSGRPPQTSRTTRALGYPDVPKQVADALNTLLRT